MRLAAICIPESLIDFFHSTKRERVGGRQRDHSGNRRWEEKNPFLINLLLLFSEYIFSGDALMLVWIHLMEQSRVELVGGGEVWGKEEQFCKEDDCGMISVDSNTGKILEIVKECSARDTWKTDAYFLYHLLEKLSSTQILDFDF